MTRGDTMGSRIHDGGWVMRQARTRLLRACALGGIPPVCNRCDRLIDSTLSGLHPDGATVGHIIPVSRGGTDAYENLALEHRRCNLHAGARLTPARATVVEPL